MSSLYTKWSSILALCDLCNGLQLVNKTIVAFIIVSLILSDEYLVQLWFKSRNVNHWECFLKYSIFVLWPGLRWTLLENRFLKQLLKETFMFEIINMTMGYEVDSKCKRHLNNSILTKTTKYTLHMTASLLLYLQAYFLHQTLLHQA